MENTENTIGAEIRSMFNEYQPEKIDLNHFTPKKSNRITQGGFSSDRLSELVDETPKIRNFTP